MCIVFWHGLIKLETDPQKEIDLCQAQPQKDSRDTGTDLDVTRRTRDVPFDWLSAVVLSELAL